MAPCNFKNTNSTTDLYFKKNPYQLFVHSMFRNIYCKCIDSMLLILTLLENEFSPTGTLHIRKRLLINGYFQTVNQSTRNGHYVLASLDGCLVIQRIPHIRELTFAMIKSQLQHIVNATHQPYIYSKHQPIQSRLFSTFKITCTTKPNKSHYQSIYNIFWSLQVKPVKSVKYLYLVVIRKCY